MQRHCPLGVGASLVIPSAAASVMGSVPGEHTGVVRGTGGTFIETGGAIGLAVIGSPLCSRYGDHPCGPLSAFHLPHALEIDARRPAAQSRSTSGSAFAGHSGRPHAIVAMLPH